MLLGLELAQGAIGFVQYFTDLPVVLVGFHMLGAALISASVTWTLVRVREPALGAAARPGTAGRAAVQRLSSGSIATATNSSER